MMLTFERSWGPEDWCGPFRGSRQLGTLDSHPGLIAHYDVIEVLELLKKILNETCV